MTSERAIVSAKASGDSLMVAAAERRLAHALMAQGNDLPAADVALDAVNTVTPDSPAAISVYGALMNSAAIASARVDDSASSNAYLNEAETMAQRLGCDGNMLYMAFGPTNVTLHRIAAAIDLGNGGQAVELARKLNPRSVRNVERRARLYLDLAHGYAQGACYGDATDALLAAEVSAPEEVRYQPDIKVLVGEMLSQSNDSRLPALAVRMGVA